MNTATPTLTPAIPCEHEADGTRCILLCICDCGQDRREIRAIAGGHGLMSAEQRRCWMGRCRL